MLLGNYKYFAALLALVALTSSCGQPAAPARSMAIPAPDVAANSYQPSATFQELMDSIVDPAADHIWDAVTFTSDASGEHEKKPTTAEDWQQFRRAAITLIESANLLAVPARRVAVSAKTAEGEELAVAAIQQRLDTRHAEIVGFASALRDVGNKLVTAADRQDVAAVTELGGTLDNVCEACHRVFWYPEHPPPESN